MCTNSGALAVLMGDGRVVTCGEANLGSLAEREGSDFSMVLGGCKNGI